MCKCLPLAFSVDYVAEMFKTLMTRLRLVADELKQDVPAPLHSMLEKESRGEAAKKTPGQETVIVPPTCTGMSEGLVV